MSVSAYTAKISESVEDKELDSILGPVQQPPVKTARRKVATKRKINVAKDNVKGALSKMF